MQGYENPPVRDDVNVGQHSAAGEFVKLSLALALGIVALVVALILGFRWLAPLIPFRYEQQLADPIATQLTSSNAHVAQQQYLQALAEQLSARMDFPADMRAQVHWSEQDIPNAFATLGGHITLYRGMVDRLHSENGLAMVLAHELAHVRHRDPLVAAGSATLVGLTLGTLLGSGSESIVGQSAAALTQLNFSRKQERAADDAALRALTAYYGHTLGASEFFVTMHQEAAQNANALQSSWFESLQSHPDIQQRIANIQSASALAPPNATLTPLPPVMQRAQKKDK